MEIDFRQITLEDRQAVESILKSSDRRFCEYTFGNMYCWGAGAGLCLSVSDGLLVFGYPESGKLYMPVGERERVLSAVDFLLGKYENLSLLSVSEDDAELLGGAFEEKFDFIEDTRAFDYIYESQRLQTLSGKKLASKRNHINAFISDGEWRVERITEKNRDELLAFNRKWCRDLCGHMSGSLKTEMCAAERGIVNFDKLGFSGLMLYKNDALAAYSYGEPINGDTFCVHVEKADSDVRGAYQMINREFVCAFCKDYEYVNREDDAGDEGLRRAKQSYCPTDIGKKFIARRRHGA